MLPTYFRNQVIAQVTQNNPHHADKSQTVYAIDRTNFSLNV